MWHPLDDAKDSLQGGREQLDQLIADIAQYLQENPDGINVAYHREDPYEVLHIHNVPAFPAKWAA